MGFFTRKKGATKDELSTTIFSIRTKIYPELSSELFTTTFSRMTKFPRTKRGPESQAFKIRDGRTEFPPTKISSETEFPPN